LAQPAEAKIVYTPAHTKISAHSNVYIDLDHDGTNDFYLNHWSVTSGGDLLWIVPVNHANEIWGKGTMVASALAAGVRIGPGERFHRRIHHYPYGYADMVNCGIRSGYPWCFGPWQHAHDRYLGLKFLVKGRVHYGWARLDVSASQLPITATLTGYAYETIPGKAIVAGKTKGPDVTTVSPANLGHLAAGASAIPSWRSGK
jgi:hypothetical protein